MTYDSTNPTAATVNTSGLVTGVSEGAASITATAGGITSAPAVVTVVGASTSDEPNLNDGSFTLRDSDDMQSYFDVDYMGAAARMSEPGQTFVPWPSPAITGGGVDHNENQVITVGGRQVLRLRYPTGGGGGSWVRKNPMGVPIADESYVQFHAMLSSEGAVPTAYQYAFAAKWLLWGLPGGMRRQCGTHNQAPFSYPGPVGITGTYWQTYVNGGFTDEYSAFPTGHDQGTQARGPFFSDMLNDGILHRITHGFKDMTPAVGTVSVTGNVATFSNPQSLSIGDRIRFSDRNGLLESNPGHARAVTAISNSTHCTVLGAFSNADINPTAFAINSGGAFSRMWIDGIKVIDVCQAKVGVMGPGGYKQWCGQDIVDAFLVGGPGRNADQLLIGSSQTEGGEIGIRIDLFDWLVKSRVAA